MLDPLASNAVRHDSASTSAGVRRAAGMGGAFARLTVQRGDPLSVLLSDMSDEAGFIHAETLEDQAKKEKAGDIRDSEATRRLEMLEKVKSVWDESDPQVSKDLDALRRARANGGREKFQELLRRFSGGDASREAALLAALVESEPTHGQEYSEDLQLLLATRGRAVEAGVSTIEESRAQSREGGESLLALQHCYQQAIAAGGSVAQVLATASATFGVARFGVGCDFLSRAAAAELSSESRPMERAHLSELSARFKGLRVFQSVVARLEEVADRVSGVQARASAAAPVAESVESAESTPIAEVVSSRSLAERFFSTLSDPLHFTEAFSAPLAALVPESRLRLLQELRSAVRELPDWTFAQEGERARLLQPIQDGIDHLVYEEGV
ncbi:MAG: hypothetical protein OD811_03610 [Alphaproteobacteria bacterium]